MFCPFFKQSWQVTYIFIYVRLRVKLNSILMGNLIIIYECDCVETSHRCCYLASWMCPLMLACQCHPLLICLLASMLANHANWLKTLANSYTLNVWVSVHRSKQSYNYRWLFMIIYVIICWLNHGIFFFSSMCAFGTDVILTLSISINNKLAICWLACFNRFGSEIQWNICRINLYI